MQGKHVFWPKVIIWTSIRLSDYSLLRVDTGMENNIIYIQKPYGCEHIVPFFYKDR